MCGLLHLRFASNINSACETEIKRDISVIFID